MDKYTIDLLTVDSVSIMRQAYVDYDGTSQPVGSIWRRAYVNSEQDRKNIVSDIPDNCSKIVLEFWGPTPTVVINDNNPVPYTDPTVVPNSNGVTNG